MNILEPLITQSSPVAHRAGLDAPGIRPVPRFRQPEAPEHSAGADPREPLPTLLFGAPLQHALGEKANVHRHNAADRRITASQFLDDQAVRDVIESRTPVLLGERRSEEALLGELADDVPIHLLGAIPVTRERHDFLVDPGPRLTTQLLLLFGESEIHRDLLFA
jgi:hypothetical protein